MIEIPCRESFVDKVLIGDDYIGPLSDAINDAINDVINDAINCNARLVLLAISTTPLIMRIYYWIILICRNVTHKTSYIP